MLLTIFTPTYNRAHTLKRTYASLVQQNSAVFEWLIVDDGSIDNTEELVKDWIKEARFPIRYYKQQNGGKHRAINHALMYAKGELFFCVDSDDFLTHDAVISIINFWNKDKSDKISGILAKKQDINGKALGKPFPNGLIQCSAFKLSTYYNSTGERSLIYRTDILKNFPATEYNGEYFLTECVVYDAIDMHYDMLLLNKTLTICEYQDTGLSAAIYKHIKCNPCGYQHFHAQRMSMVNTLRKLIMHSLYYGAFMLMSGNKGKKCETRFIPLIIILLPFSFCLALYFKYRK